jgi:hypothetical protein
MNFTPDMEDTDTPKPNFGPQIGFAYDLAGKGRTVIRSAAGLYVEERTFDGFPLVQH